MIGAFTVRSINPYGNGHDVQFSIDYKAPWASFELIPFIILGILGVIKLIINFSIKTYFKCLKRVYGELCLLN